MSIEVVKPGLLTSFQDLGRTGFQALGVPVCGAMDEISHKRANRAVGNRLAAPTLELTMLGPTLLFHSAAVIAVCGADLGARFLVPATPVSPGGEETQLALGKATHVPAGSMLRFSGRASGLRAYLAVRGGYEVAPVMGSCSTYLRGGFGGWQGRQLKKGDRIRIDSRWRCATGEREAESNPQVRCADLPLAGTPLRVLPGREWDKFSDLAKLSLLSQPYQVTSKSDRMGYRLEGAALELSRSHEMLSEAVTFGTVQVPPDGKPIILMADRQTTGGYPRIAAVATVDLPRLAQVSPGEVVTFQSIDLDEAHRLLLAGVEE